MYRLLFYYLVDEENLYKQFLQVIVVSKKKKKRQGAGALSSDGSGIAWPQRQERITMFKVSQILSMSYQSQV